MSSIFMTATETVPVLLEGTGVEVWMSPKEAMDYHARQDEIRFRTVKLLCDIERKRQAGKRNILLMTVALIVCGAIALLGVA